MEIPLVGDFSRKLGDIRYGGERGNLEIDRCADKDSRASYRIDAAVVRFRISGNRDIHIVFVVILRRCDCVAIS